MPRIRFSDTCRFSQGYRSARPIIEPNIPNPVDVLSLAPKDYAAAGSANVLFTGSGRPEVFKGFTLVSGTAGSQMFQFSNGYASLGLKSVSAGVGSIFSYIARSLWYIGAGRVLFNGATLTGSPDAATTLKFRLFDTGAYNGTTYTAGLAAPAAPVIAVGAVGTKLVGSYSVRLSAVRSTTGAESNASQSSPAVTFNNEKCRVTFPAAVGNGQDKWGVYVTLKDFGTKGPHYLLPPSLTGESPIGFVKESTVAASVLGGAGLRNLDFEWFDGDLMGQDLAPITNFVPPIGTHAFALEGCIAVVGCYGDVTSALAVGTPGNMIAVSKAGFPEAFPTDPDHLLALPEPPTLVLSRAASGVVYIAGKNSLSVARYTGQSSKAPLALSTLWPDAGFATYTNACMADGQLYDYTGIRGPVRIDGDGNPDYAFASDISRQFDGVAASAICVGYDPSSTMVVYGYTSGGVSRLICFNKAYQLWSAPINFEDLVAVPAGGPATIKEMFTNAGQLYIVLDTGGAEYAIYQFNAGTGATWKLRSAWRDGGAPEQNKTITKLHFATDNDSANTLTLDVYKNLITASKAESKNFTPTGAPEHRYQRTNIINAKTYAVHLQGTDSNTTGIEVALEGIVSAIKT